MLQVARYILKCYNRVHRGSSKPLASTVAYLRTEGNFILDTEDQATLRNPDILIKTFINNSCYRIKKAGEKILSGVTGGMDMKKTWDEHSGIELVEAATAHSYYWMVNNYHEAVKAISDKDTQTAMNRLLLLYTIDKILEYSTSFFETKSITSSTFKALRELRYQLLEEIRPDALTLV